MEKLLESFKTLNYLGTQILFFIEVYETYTNNTDYLNKIQFKGHYSNLPFAKAISGSLLNYSLIICNSFIDEYNDEFSVFKHPEHADRILRVKKITKPVMKRLSKWKNFKDYRNYILAHSFRVDGKSFFSKDFEPFHFNAPHTNSEIVLVAELIKIITTCIALEFPELVEQLDWKENLLTKMTFNHIEVDINNELTEVWTQIDSIKASIA